MGDCPETVNGPVDASERFLSLLTAAQGPLYAYICTLLGGSNDAADVLQETNLVLWKKMDEFDSSLSFSAWANKFAFLQVLAYRKRRATDRHQFTCVMESMQSISAKAESESEQFARRLRMLDDCIESLSDYQRQLVQMRYARRLGVKAISLHLQKSENSVAAALYRARLALIECVDTKQPGRATP